MKKLFLFLLLSASISAFAQSGFPVTSGTSGFPVSIVDGLKQAGYQIIGTNPCHYTNTAFGAANIAGRTYRTRHVAMADAKDIVLMYANYTVIIALESINPNWNPMNIGASLQKQGTTVNDITPAKFTCTFNGALKKTVDPMGYAFTDPTFFSVKKGEPFYIWSYRNAILPMAPPTPTASNSNVANGTLVSGSTYNVCVAYVMPDGSFGKTSDAVAVSVTNNSITVTSPPEVLGASGYVVYCSGRNANINGTYAPATDWTAFGTNAVVVNEISNVSLRIRNRNGVTYVTGGNGGAGGTNREGLDNGEGTALGDLTITNATDNNFGAQALANAYYPVAILGKSTEQVRSFALIGNSIQQGTGDGGYIYQSGGFATRAVNNQLQPRYNPSTAPLFPYVRVPLGGEKAQQFADSLSSNKISRVRYMPTEFATDVICEYGTNDLSLGLTSMKNSILAIARFYTSRGIYFYQTTLVPKTTSTDQWRTVANQTITGEETTRLAFNAWIRDTSASGFVQQANAQAKKKGLVKTIDVCKYVEVNSSNVLTQNGGFWRIPSGFTNITGTVTSVTDAVTFTDNTKSFTRNQYKGYSIVFTSGAQANKSGEIFWNDTAGTFNISISNSNSVAPAVGDSYIITERAVNDGIHPTSTGHILMANAVLEAINP